MSLASLLDPVAMEGGNQELTPEILESLLGQVHHEISETMRALSQQKVPTGSRDFERVSLEHKTLSSELKQLEKELDDYTNDLESTINKILLLDSEFKNKQLMLQFLDFSTQFYTSKGQVEVLIGTGVTTTEKDELLKTLQILTSMENLIVDIVNSLSIYGVTTNDWFAKHREYCAFAKYRLADQVDLAFDNMFLISDNEVIINASNDKKNEILHCINGLGTWDTCTSRFSSMIEPLVLNLLQPVDLTVKSDENRFCIDISCTKTNGGGERRWEDVKGKNHFLGKICQRLGELLNFLSSIELFPKNQSYPEHLLVQIKTWIKIHVWDKLTPSNPAELTEFPGLIQEFQQGIDQLGLVCGDDWISGPQVIEAYVNRICLFFLGKLRRKLLETEDYKTMMLTDTKSELLPADLMLSKRCFEFQRLFDIFLEEQREILFSSPEQQAACVLNIWQTFRKGMLLWPWLQDLRAIQQVPNLAAIFHNDCLYLAHYFNGLPFLLCETFKGFSPPKFIAVDISTQLRQIGQHQLNRQLTLQKGQLEDFFDALDGLYDLSEPERREQVDRVFEQVTYSLEQLNRTLYPLLGLSVYQSTLAPLVNVVVERVIWEVTNLVDISAADSECLTDLMRHVWQSCQNLLHVSTKSPLGLKSGRKYNRLIKVLDGSFSQLMQLFRNGDLRELFSKEELVRLICALFSDTPLRAQHLSEIREEY